MTYRTDSIPEALRRWGIVRSETAIRQQQATKTFGKSNMAGSTTKSHASGRQAQRMSKPGGQPHDTFCSALSSYLCDRRSRRSQTRHGGRDHVALALRPLAVRQCIRLPAGRDHSYILGVSFIYRQVQQRINRPALTRTVDLDIEHASEETTVRTVGDTSLSDMRQEQATTFASGPMYACRHSTESVPPRQPV